MSAFGGNADLQRRPPLGPTLTEADIGSRILLCCTTQSLSLRGVVRVPQSGEWWM
jgi:hypothetical protein